MFGSLSNFLGGSPMAVLVRLLIISFVVGLLLETFGFDPSSLFHQAVRGVRRLIDYGFSDVRHVAEILITGHDHMYQRFAPMDASGNVDPAGMREFVSGAGGRPFYNVVRHVAGIQKVITHHWGVLQLKLSSGGYSWKFLSAPSGKSLDSGSGSCH